MHADLYQRQAEHPYNPAVLTPGHPQVRPLRGTLPPHSSGHPGLSAHLAQPSPGSGLTVTFWVVAASLIAAGAAAGAYFAGVFS
jgi:hypothetical protein